MRSTLQRSLLLFVFMSCALATDISSNRNTIACQRGDNENDNVIFFAWSASGSHFQQRHAFGVKECDAESIVVLCRIAFSNVSYGISTNKTIQVNQEIFWFHHVSDNRTTIPRVLETFQCQDYIRAKELDVPVGSWADRLIAGHSTNMCKTEKQLKKQAKDECGAEPTHSSLGGKCGESDKYLEVLFVCNHPKDEALFEVDESFVEKKDAYMHKSQFTLLNHYAKVAEDLKEAKLHNNTAAIFKLTRKLDSLLHTATTAVRHAHKLSDITEIQQPKYFGEEFESREVAFARAKTAVRSIGIDRSERLFLLAASLISNKSEHVTERLRDFKFATYDSVNINLKLYFLAEFPELKPKIQEYYTDYCRNHTLGIAREHLGFLNESGAHGALIAMYEEIFNPNLIDVKYLSTTYSFAFKVYLLTGIAVIVVVVVLFLISDKKRRLGNFKIRFTRGRETLVENSIDNPVFVL